jgi:hypothetical protein
MEDRRASGAQDVIPRKLLIPRYRHQDVPRRDPNQLSNGALKHPNWQMLQDLTADNAIGAVVEKRQRRRVAAY